MTSLSISGATISVAITGDTTGVRVDPQGQINLNAVAGPQNIAVQFVGTQGPAGAGAVAPGFESIAAVALSALHVVYRAADGLRYASSDAPITAAQAVGILPSAINANAVGFVQTGDEITDASWSWSLGSVWLGINGALTQTPVSSGAQVEIGIAISPNTLLIRVQPSILIQ
jgi:hypothetical protein